MKDKRLVCTGTDTVVKTPNCHFKPNLNMYKHVFFYLLTYALARANALNNYFGIS